MVKLLKQKIVVKCEFLKENVLQISTTYFMEKMRKKLYWDGAMITGQTISRYIGE